MARKSTPKTPKATMVKGEVKAAKTLTGEPAPKDERLQGRVNNVDNGGRTIDPERRGGVRIEP